MLHENFKFLRIFKLLQLQLETSTQVIGVKDMDASDLVRLCSAIVDVVKSKVEEQHAKNDSL